MAHRLRALDTRLALQIYELDRLQEKLERVDPCKNGNVASWLVTQRESELLKERAIGALAAIVAMAPEVVRMHEVPADISQVWNCKLHRRRLVAPALRFHPRADVHPRYLAPEMEVIRVGLAESWRRGLRVMMRQ